jgi:putative oxidoreductase
MLNFKSHKKLFPRNTIGIIFKNTQSLTVQWGDSRMAKKKYTEYAPTLLRILIGVLFLVQGIQKLGNPDGVSGMLSGIGFPIPLVFAWILILSEVVFGAAVLVGWKTKYAVWPLVLIMVVAALVGGIQWGTGFVSVMLHLITAAALVSIYFTGPGKLAIE